ncbi:hypothetical protein FGO68_gene17234 [Halteria grandinella]|uniref:Uncharacterized protein n=1 Tax=Halteria grandinella TaxID=5974 RepID=A0A8J8TAQ7_HALGN|nr:hypothetical protein FGO68_gene17234 [Halteria grandinella]
MRKLLRAKRNQSQRVGPESMRFMYRKHTLTSTEKTKFERQFQNSQPVLLNRKKSISPSDPQRFVEYYSIRMKQNLKNMNDAKFEKGSRDDNTGEINQSEAEQTSWNWAIQDPLITPSKAWVLGEKRCRSSRCLAQPTKKRKRGHWLYLLQPLLRRNQLRINLPRASACSPRSQSRQERSARRKRKKRLKRIRTPL